MRSGQAPWRFAQARGTDDPAPASDPTTAPAGVSTTAPGSRTNNNERTDAAVKLEEIIITGSHIRGVSNDSSPMMSFDHEYIERSGFTNMMELVESLPINFKGGGSVRPRRPPSGRRRRPRT